MTGVITITTDFGHKGPFVALMKAVILCRSPAATIVDYTHEIPVHWPPEAGFWLMHGYHYFPAGSVHIAVVDPGVGTERDILIVTIGEHRFLAPDNGLLGALLECAEEPIVHQLDLARVSEKIGLRAPSATFHGRDIFAPVAAEIHAGRLALAETGPRVHDWTPSQIDASVITRDRVSGTVITVDTFGNLITNITQSDIAALDNPLVGVGGHDYPMQTTYGRATPGSCLALINSFGVVEIAVAEGSATEALGIERGAPVTVHEALPANR